MTGFAFHPGAVSDIDEILGIIANDNPNAAHRVAAELSDTFQTVSRFPNAGHLRSDLTARPLRFRTVRDYLVAYAPELKPVWIVAVLHGRRSPRVIASILRSRR